MVDVALEVDDCIHRYPVITPAPGIELRFFAGAQTYVATAPNQPEKKPDLLLSAVIAPPIAFDPLVRHVIAQPLACASENFHVLRAESNFLPQLPVHRELRS